MSRLRATTIVRALADKSRDGDAGRLATRLRAVANASAVADALVLATVPARRRESSTLRGWQWGTAGATVVAAVLAARGIADLESMLPHATSGLAMLPLFALPLLFIAFVVGRFAERGAPSAPSEADEAMVADIAQTLCAVDVPDELALETAAWIAGLSKAEAERRFDAKNVRQSIAVAQTTSQSPSVVSGQSLASLGVGAAVVFVVMAFWILYFSALGRSALTGAW